MRERFDRFAEAIADLTGSPGAFGAALLTVLLWAITGPFTGFGATWQLTIGTITTIATFLMVFVIQADSNRTSRAMNLKLDAIIQSLDKVDDALIDAEHQTTQEVQEHKDQIKEGNG